MKTISNIIKIKKQFTPNGLDNRLLKEEICNLIDKMNWGGNFQIHIGKFNKIDNEDDYSAEITITY